MCPCGLTIPACTLNEMNGDREPVLLCPVKIACGIFAPKYSRMRHVIWSVELRQGKTSMNGRGLIFDLAEDVFPCGDYPRIQIAVLHAHPLLPKVQHGIRGLECSSLLENS